MQKLMVDKRKDANYKQVSGYIPKELALRFKSLCVASDQDISHVLEELIRDWVEKQDK